MNKGFSLIELLVGTAIIITTTTVILAIIMSSFRISSKSTSLDSVRQSGNYAISRMAKMIQFADSFNSGSFNNLDYNQLCPTAAGGGPHTYSSIKITYDKLERTPTCSTDNKIYIDSGELINSSKISVLNCSIKCIRVNPSASPVITIKFDLSFGTAGTLVEKKAAIPFSTSVMMRNK